MKMRRCEDEKMFYRPPLLEEPCAQTLSGKKCYVTHLGSLVGLFSASVIQQGRSSAADI